MTIEHVWTIEPVGDRCLLIRLGDRVDRSVSETVHAVTEAVRGLTLPAVLDVVPAFTTVAVHYDVSVLDPARGTAFSQMKAAVDGLLRSGVPALTASGRSIEIPVCYGGQHGPDLEAVATHCAMSTDDVIRIHSAQPQTIYTFFFAPGNPFSGPVDDRLHIPRRTSPRTRVPAGSVAIANGLTCIYQTASPGGWHLIAKTPLNLFDVTKATPLRLQLGDELIFVPITPKEYDTMLERPA